MKKTLSILIVAFVMTAMVSCGEKDNTPSNGGGNSNGNSNNDSNTPAGWVDLGLPSGLLWAECNLGANTPEEWGDYFAWGETETKSAYNWDTYRYGHSINELTKYCYEVESGYNGFTDTLTLLEPEDDAVMVHIGNGARMPTKNEWTELKENTVSEWTTRNGVNGRLFTAENGQSIFLPAAGSRFNNDHDTSGTWGHYWTSSLVVYGGCFYSHSFHFTDELCDVSVDSRNTGFSVRAVRPRQR